MADDSNLGRRTYHGRDMIARSVYKVYSPPVGYKVYNHPKRNNICWFDAQNIFVRLYIRLNTTQYVYIIVYRYCNNFVLNLMQK